MKSSLIVLKTNLDNYDGSKFPDFNLIGYIPRKGEYIEVLPVAQDYYRTKNLPIGLEVVDVKYSETKPIGNWDQPKLIISIELWYRDSEYQLFTQSGHKLL